MLKSFSQNYGCTNCIVKFKVNPVYKSTLKVFFNPASATKEQLHSVDLWLSLFNGEIGTHFDPKTKYFKSQPKQGIVGDIVTLYFSKCNSTNDLVIADVIEFLTVMTSTADTIYGIKAEGLGKYPISTTEELKSYYVIDLVFSKNNLMAVQNVKIV